MKITLEPTAVLRCVDGVEHREWRGNDDEGVEVVALIRAVSPQTHDPAVAGRYAAALRDIGFARAAPIDLRFVL